MFEYIKLQMKLRWGRDRSASKKSGMLTAAVGILVICAALSLIYLLTRILADNLEETTAAELSVLFIAVLEAALFVMSVCMQVRWLYRPADLEITARFPITPFKIYVANIALVYFNLLIYAALFFVPVLTVFGLALKIFTAQYFFGILICAFLSPALPFAISLVVAIPVMYALSLLENKNTVKLILFIVVLAAFFVLYNYVLSVLAEYFLHNNVSSETSIVWTKILKTLNGRGNLTAYLGDVLFLNGFWKAFGILLGASLGVSAAGLALAKPVYDGAHRKMLEGAGNAFRRRGDVPPSVQRDIANALIRLFLPWDRRRHARHGVFLQSSCKRSRRGAARRNRQFRRVRTGYDRVYGADQRIFRGGSQHGGGTLLYYEDRSRVLPRAACRQGSAQFGGIVRRAARELRDRRVAWFCIHRADADYRRYGICAGRGFRSERTQPERRQSERETESQRRDRRDQRFLYDVHRRVYQRGGGCACDNSAVFLEYRLGLSSFGGRCARLRGSEPDCLYFNCV